MRKSNYLVWIAVALAAYWAGSLSRPATSVRADTGDTPVFQMQPVRGDTSLAIYYPNLKKLFVYQTPFIGLPTWNCAYAIQLSTPGGSIERQTCPNSGQAY